MVDKIEIVASAELPVDEELEIFKHRFMPDNVTPAKLEDDKKRIAIVTGIHGDELEGQYVCYELARRIREKKENLAGIVDIYPAMNPFGIDNITRGIPAFDLDMNRLFPGNSNGDMNEYIAAEIMKDMEGTTLCLDIHASNIFLTEAPQIRINEEHKDILVPIALKSNVDLVWVHGASTVLESTFAYSLNSRGINTLVVEMGVGMRITKEYGDQMVDGIFSLMSELGIWKEKCMPSKEPVLSNDEQGQDVYYLNAEVSGIFMKEKTHGMMVEEGELIGIVVDPLMGNVLSEVKAPGKGWLFTIREYPVVDEGSLVGRILKI
ncbi:MAG: succinylglutamate desuccinylase/aspartoacylase family protein [Lachnospiraceae bacterium]|nr:succinylglutamate desuccinylase/aspartoacylase family protein [Lachnospiraceae bacterium]